MKTVFLRVMEAEDKATALLDAVHQSERVRSRTRFDVDAASFSSVPRSPFSYWVSERLRGLFESLPGLGAEGRVVASGGKTLDDFRWIRAAWEVPQREASTWVGFAKGGVFSPFYSDVHLLLDWCDGARSLKEYLVSYRSTRGWSPNWTAELHGSDHYLRPGLTWPRRTQGGLSLRAMPAGCVFADKGPAAFARNDGSAELLALLATTNSRAFKAMVEMQMAFGSYEVGVLQRTPVPALTETSGGNLARLARRAWSLKHSLDSRNETSHAFTLPALLQVTGADLAQRAAIWSRHVQTIETELAAIQAEIDDRCFSLYGIDDTDRHAIIEGFGTSDSAGSSGIVTNDAEDDAEEDTDESASTIDAADLAADLVSWAVGVTFGRFDARLAAGARPIPIEPEPFEPLPICSPGMLVGEDGLPLTRAPSEYPLTFPENGVLVDDQGHALDLTAAVHAAFGVAFGTDADRWWNDVATLLDPKDHDRRAWLAGSFFEHHLKRYSKSRRKAPILWQLATPSIRYSVWLYAHHLTRDTFFQIQNEIVGPKLAHEDRKLTGLVQNAGGNPSASERKEIATQEAIVEELRGMLEEIRRIAPLWNPNLDDGVVLTMAPLWRLVPHHKPWQRELKTKWDELVAAKYDWAHIAMHLWPERVVPKCAADRSLAIAHGLEDVFWIEGADGKWTLRATPVRPIDDLVRERSSPAVKAALNSLLSAPSASSTGRARKRNGITTAAS